MSDNDEERKSPPRVPVRRVRREFCFVCGVAILGHHGLCHQQECIRSFLARTTVAEDTAKGKEKTDGDSVQQPDQGKATPEPKRGGSQLGGRGRRESLLSKQIREYDLQQATLLSGPAQDPGESVAPPAVAAAQPPVPHAQDAGPSPPAAVAADLPPAPLAQDPSPSQATPAIAAGPTPVPLAHGAGPSPSPAIAVSLPPVPLAHGAGPPQATPAIAVSLPPVPHAQGTGPSPPPAEDLSATGSDVDPRKPRSEPIPIPIIGYYRDEFRSAPITPEPVPNVNVSDPERVIFFPDSPLVVPSAPEHTK